MHGRADGRTSGRKGEWTDGRTETYGLTAECLIGAAISFEHSPAYYEPSMSLGFTIWLHDTARTVILWDIVNCTFWGLEFNMLEIIWNICVYIYMYIYICDKMQAVFQRFACNASALTRVSRYCSFLYDFLSNMLKA